MGSSKDEVRIAMSEKRPDPADHHPFYRGYIDLVPGGDVLETLEAELRLTLGVLERFDDARAGRSYAGGKWTLKELVGHLTDTERVFTFRALSIARNDPSALPGMDQDVWVRGGAANDRTFADLCEELRLLRLCTDLRDPISSVA